MIKIERINVMNIDNAIHGMRNPKESHDKSDSIFGVFTEEEYYERESDKCQDNWNKFIKSYEEYEIYSEWASRNYFLRYDGHALSIAALGPNDLELAEKLVLGGSDHSKFTRQIFVSMDITAPLYWWKELDTYKVGTVANSESTMHKLATTPITRECFSFDKELDAINTNGENYYSIGKMNDTIVDYCEKLRQLYLESNDINYWRALIQLLPESWNQTRTWTADYAVLRNIYFARKNHKLTEWHDFCKMITKLGYGRELICLTKDSEFVLGGTICKWY